MTNCDHAHCTLCGKCLTCEPHPPHTATRTRIFMLLAAALLAALGVSAQPAHAATYGYLALGSGTTWCVADPGAQHVNGVHVKLQLCNLSDEGDFWALTEVPGNPFHYSIHAHAGAGAYCLDDPGNSTDYQNLVHFQIWQCNNTAAQAFIITGLSQGGFTVSLDNGMAVDDYGDYLVSGNSIIIWPLRNPAPPAEVYCGLGLAIQCA